MISVANSCQRAVVLLSSQTRFFLPPTQWCKQTRDVPDGLNWVLCVWETKYLIKGMLYLWKGVDRFWIIPITHIFTCWIARDCDGHLPGARSCWFESVGCCASNVSIEHTGRHKPVHRGYESTRCWVQEHILYNSRSKCLKARMSQTKTSRIIYCILRIHIIYYRYT